MTLSKNIRAKYERIIDEWFVNEFNGAAAYRKYYKNVKDSTATANFSRIQNMPEMYAYIHLKHREAAKVIDVTKEGILKELKNWIESDITETISLSPEEIKELPIEIRRLISKFIHRINKNYNKEGVLVGETETIELQFVSKERAIDMINKHIGFYEADNRQKAPQINYDGLSENTLLEIWNARKESD